MSLFNILSPTTAKKNLNNSFYLYLLEHVLDGSRKLEGGDQIKLCNWGSGAKFTNLLKLKLLLNIKLDPSKDKSYSRSILAFKRAPKVKSC